MNGGATQVLVVEDEEPIRRFRLLTLKAEGYDVLGAKNAREGRTLAGNRRVDLYLIDLGCRTKTGMS